MGDRHQRARAQTWFDTVQVIDRYYKDLRAHSESKKKQLSTAPQRLYLTFLVSEVDVGHFDAELAKALKGICIAKRKLGEESAQVIDRLTKDTAHTPHPDQEPPKQCREPAVSGPVADHVHNT